MLVPPWCDTGAAAHNGRHCTFRYNNKGSSVSSRVRLQAKPRMWAAAGQVEPSRVACSAHSYQAAGTSSCWCHGADSTEHLSEAGQASHSFTWSAQSHKPSCTQSRYWAVFTPTSLTTRLHFHRSTALCPRPAGTVDHSTGFLTLVIGTLDFCFKTRISVFLGWILHMKKLH